VIVSMAVKEKYIEKGLRVMTFLKGERTMSCTSLVE